MSTFLMSNVSQTLINFQLCTEKEVFFYYCEELFTN